MSRTGTIWQDPGVVETFVREVRGGIPHAVEQVAALLRVVAATGRPVRRMADLGCGSGVLATVVLGQNPGAEAVLVDFSEPMLEAAREAFAGADPRPAFVVGDLADPAWIEGVRPHAPFDVVVSSYAIHHLPDGRKRALYGEILALLAPGGAFVNVEHVASPTPWVEAIWDGLMVDSLLAFQQSRGTGRSRAEIADDYARRPDKEANLLTPVETQCEWLRELGYSDVDCYFKVFELAVFGGRRPGPDPVPSPGAGD